MEAISNWFIFLLVNSVWQIAAITSVSFACDWLLRGTQARYRHALWVTALVLCFGLPLVSSFALGPFRNSAPEAISPTLQIADAEPAETIGNANVIREQDPWVIPINSTALSVLLVLYALLIGYRLFKLVRAFQRAGRIRQNSFAADWSESDARSIEDCKTRFGLENIEVLRSAKVSSPITLGAMRPVIVLPDAPLGENDRNILISAVSHELNHVRRRDYLKNLFYELIYLPISFHPAATLVKRRIRDTRELVCDEYVTEKLVEPAVYARSLVSIAGMAMDLGRTANITIGILDDGVLEKRIMKILNRPKITTFRRNLLLGSSTLVLALAIIAAMSFSLTPVIAQQKSASDKEADRSKKEADEQLKKMVEELRNPSPQTEEAMKKIKESLGQQLSDDDFDTYTIGVAKGVGDGDAVSLGVSKGVLEEFVAKREAERMAELLNRADLAKNMNISMAQAINIATAQQLGTVLETKLAFERNGGEKEEPFYIVTIVVEKDGVSSEKRVIVSGIDGSVGGPHNN